MFWLRYVVLAFLCSCVWKGEGSIPPGVDTRLTFLHTSDLHSRLLPFELTPTAADEGLGLRAENAPFGGAARLGYLIKRERSRAQRVLHLDSGDCFQGAPIFNLDMGEAELRFLTLMGLDGAVIGNHEFDGGLNNMVNKLATWAQFPVLAANYVFPDANDPDFTELGRIATPTMIYNVDGLRVGVIGMANLGSLTSIGEGGNSLQITPLEQNETVRSYVRQLHPSVDLIVVLSHLGLTEDEELIRGYERVVWKDNIPPDVDWEIREDLGDGRVMVFIPGVAHIDAILGGHLHVVLNPPKVVQDVDGRDVVIEHSGAFAKYLGRLDVVARDDAEYGGKRIVSHKYQVFPVDQRLAPYEDVQTTEMLNPYVLRLNQALDLRRVIGYAPKSVTRRSATGNGDSQLGNLVTEAMRARRRVAAEIAITNTLGIRDNIYAGPITLEDMFNVFPFENTLTVMYLSGAELQEVVDFITSRSASRGCQSQAQIAGMRMTMNCSKVLANQNAGLDWAAGNPGEDITVRDVPISPSATYKLATNDYIANGGSGFLVLKRNTTKVDTGVPLRDALIDYLGTLETCGQYEVDKGGACFGADESSQKLCADTVDCGRYLKTLSGCSETERQKLPLACADAVSDDCQLIRNVKGPYADTPCVVGIEDNRIRRKTSAGLDSLDDEGGDGSEGGQ